MSEVPYMPKVVARHFEDVIRAAARKMHSRWESVFEFQDLEQEAWSIALHHWQAWSDQKPLARKDLNLRLWHWVESRLPALGFQRVRVEGGKRRWVRTVRELSFAPEVIGSWDVPEEAEEDCGLELSSDWTPMGRRQREKFARILMRDYPVLVAEFLTVESMVKPSNRSVADWDARKEGKRARLRVKYARELAEARYAVEWFTSEDLAAA